MCLIAWNWQPESPTPLLVISNRDEYYARPTRPLRLWPTAVNGAKVLAGQDMQAGGTWLGITKSGRFAAITNFRTGEIQKPNVGSRGELVAGFLQSDLDANCYLETLKSTAANYNPFNLLVFDGTVLMGFESRESKLVALEKGIGALSNAGFDTPWPKLTKIKEKLRIQVGFNTTDTHSLTRLLHDTSIATDQEMPSTGVPAHVEKALSAAFIKTPGYGTRACSVLHMHRAHTEFFEEIFDESGLIGSSTYQFFR